MGGMEHRLHYNALTAMDTPSTMVQQYLAQQVRLGAMAVFEEQHARAETSVYSDSYEPLVRRRTYHLREALASPQIRVAVTAGGVSVDATVPLYMRFLDMRRLGNHKIYNRPLWGILYKETIKNIRYEYREWLSERLHALLSESRP